MLPLMVLNHIDKIAGERQKTKNPNPFRSGRVLTGTGRQQPSGVKE